MSSEQQNYYIERSGQITGPYQQCVVGNWIEDGTILATDRVYNSALQKWMPISSWQDMFAATDKVIPPSLPMPPPASNVRDIDMEFSLRTKNCTMAYVSFGLACLSFFLAAIAAVPGVICGHIAMEQCRKNPAYIGKSWAVAGLIISYIMIAANVLVLIAVAFLWAYLFAK